MDKEYDVKNEKVFNEMLQYMKVKAKRYSCSCTHLRAVGRHLLYGITQRYLPPDSSERTPPNPSQKGWYSINLLQSDGRLSLPKWLATHQYGLPAHRRSPIQV